MIPPLKLINEEINDFRAKSIAITPGYYFSQKKMINTAYLYLNSKFEMGEIDDAGDKKYFYNVVSNPCKIYSKSIDFDTKNIRLLTVAGSNPFKTWYMERDLKYWMRDKQLGKLLNRIFDELPKFGSVVVKIVNNVPMVVDLRNFYCAQSADTLDDSHFITEIHPYTVAKFRKIGKEMGWTKVEEVISKFREMKDKKNIDLYERYGEIQNEDGTWAYKKIYVADVGEDNTKSAGTQELTSRGVLMDEVEVEGHPYWEFHLEKIPGRWLGVSVVETLIDPQIRQNELSNLQSKATYWRSIVLFQSKDPAMGGKNLKTDKSNGDVLDASQGEMTQVDVSDRNLAFFNDEYTKWMKVRDELTFAYDVVQGERLPSGTPLGSAQIAISQTLSHFEKIQENIAMTVKELLYKVIIPNFVKESTPEHMIRLVGKDLDTYISMILEDEVLKQAIRVITKGKMPNNADLDVYRVAIENGLKEKGEIIKKLPKGFYSDVKYDADIDIVGEAIDTRTRSATKFAIMQFVQSDPTALTDPFKKALIFSMAEDGGVNLNDFIVPTKKSMEDQMMMANAKQGGGGVSAPAQLQNPTMGEKTSTV